MKMGSKNPRNLKSLLESGEITQAEYDEKIKKIKEKRKKGAKRKTGLIDYVKGLME